MANEYQLALYRKYRPKTFGEVLNQAVVKQTLQNAIRLGKVSHAYLFAGPRGTGKTTIARLIAKSLNCQKRKPDESEPCNECKMCQEMNAGRALDLIEIDAASNRGIDEIRELRDGIKFSPVKGKYKVFIIDEAHMLTPPAFNALLKTLEEPPEHAIFILATTEPEKLPPTILSRVQRFDFRRISISDIIKKLQKDIKEEGLKAEPEALYLIASVSEGSIRDAESLLAQVVAFQEHNTIS
ncbi:MAG: DNA polymerase III subunit gamma/tau, partial [Candidatus Paceibacteria bacterium]